MMKERIRLIHTLLKKELAEAPEEDSLTYDERDMYAEMQNLKESLEKVYNEIFAEDEIITNRIINEDNIDEYRDEINSTYHDSIKLTALNLLECSYSHILESNRFSEDMLDEIAYDVCGNEEFNNDMDSLIMRRIEECDRENRFQEEENVLWK